MQCPDGSLTQTAGATPAPDSQDPKNNGRRVVLDPSPDAHPLAWPLQLLCCRLDAAPH